MASFIKKAKNANTVSINFEGGEAIVSGLAGIQLQVALDQYDPDILNNEKDQELRIQVTKQTGTFLQYIEIQNPNKLEDYEESEFLDENVDIDISVSFNKGYSNIAGFYSNPDGDYGWVFPNEEISAEEKRNFTFNIPKPEEWETSEDNTINPYSRPQNIVFRVATFQDPDYKSPDGDLNIRDHLFTSLSKNPQTKKFEFQPTSPTIIWETLEHDQNKGKPVLLLIHGMNGTSNKAFIDFINSEALTFLTNEYGENLERVISFDHPTIRKGVERNVEKFIKILFSSKKGFQDKNFPSLDILTRSRGALVARWLLEKKLDDYSHEYFLKKNFVRKVVMLAGPNQGSHSARKGNGPRARKIRNLLRRLDRKFTKYSNNKHKSEIIDSSAEMLYDFKVSYHNAILSYKQCKGFPGSVDQRPECDCIEELNNAQKTAWVLPPYYGISTELELKSSNWPVPNPKKQKRISKILEKIEDRLNENFDMNENEVNDGINPTEGAFGARKDDYLKGKEPYSKINLNMVGYKIIGKEHRAHHINYMNVVAVRVAIVKFLNSTYS